MRSVAPFFAPAIVVEVEKRQEAAETMLDREVAKSDVDSCFLSRSQSLTQTPGPLTLS